MEPWHHKHLVDAFRLMAACRAGSIGRAATQLRTKTDRVTSSIRSLEKNYGLKLIASAGMGREKTVLTRQAHRLFEACQGVFESLDSFNEVWTHALDRARVPELSVAATGIGIKYELPAALAAWSREYPEIPIRIKQTRFVNIPLVVARQECRIGITDQGLREAEGLTGRRFKGCTWIAACSSADGLTGVHEIDRELGWILVDRGRHGRELLTRVLGQEPRQRLEVSTYEEAACFAAEGLGGVICHGYALEKYRDRLKPITLPGIPAEDLTFHGELLYLGRLDQMDEAEQKFVTLYLDQMKKWHGR